MIKLTGFQENGHKFPDSQVSEVFGHFLRFLRLRNLWKPNGHVPDACSFSSVLTFLSYYYHFHPSTHHHHHHNRIWQGVGNGLVLPSIPSQGMFVIHKVYQCVLITSIDHI